MKESIHKYFQISTIQWMSHPKREVLQSIKDICSDDFFDAIEIREFEDTETRSAAKKLLDQSHMTVCYVSNPMLLRRKDLNINSLDETVRKNTEKALIEALDEAEYFGAKGMCLMAGKWETETRDKAYEQLLKTVCAVCETAAERGMYIEMEVFDYDVDKAVLIGPAPLAARFAADVRTSCPNFGLLVDLSHIPITHEEISDAVSVMRPYITHFHIGNAVTVKDAPQYGDMHPRFGLANSANDTKELLEFFRVLKREGFFRPESQYVLSFEVKPGENEDEDIILANTKRVVNRAWALLED